LLDPAYDRARRSPRAELLALTPTTTSTMVILPTTPSPMSVAETTVANLTETCR
jgi:hypothetical protein